MKRSLGILLVLMLAMGTLFVGCAKDGATEVYFLNFKPEVAEIYDNEVVPAFEAENPGYKLKVVTAASGTYEQTFNSEVAKSNPPVIFQVNGPVGLNNQKNAVADLSSTDFYKILGDKSMALTLDGKAAAIPYAVEGYGIIYNNTIMNKYFALDGAKAKSMDDIKNYDTLKAVVEDMQAKKDALGIKGVFASTSMSAGNQWRWQTHTVNVPLYKEFLDDAPDANPLATGLTKDTIAFKYGGNMKNIMDLYTNNSLTAKTLLGAKTVDESMAEFALGQCAMVQNGNWAAGQILGVAGNTVAAEDIKFLPIYTGIDGEEGMGLCVGTENYLCINKNASKDAQKGADVFLTWLFSSETGKKLVSTKLNFITPFNTFSDADLPADPLSKEVSKWMNKPGVTSVMWVFNAIPSEEWKNQFGDAMLQYFEGKTDWADVEKVAVDAWAAEKALTK
ncbi:MAG: carbohydrate ABC transporter substrate-binding protein [Spirochaetaceae bacterium]|nr:carbohydrate ABC transporter substrate-binding protein [Spirochaetaceae bacterium]MBP3561244.1 carbohydrate ABC transporter substrate-binding protein [Treponema sp.]